MGSESSGLPRNASAASRAPPSLTSACCGTRCSNVLSDMTTILAACATASFSFAICSVVSPSTSVCSSATFVSWTTSAPTMFVASSRPPRPASTTATCTSVSANSSMAAAVSTSNCVAPSSTDGSRTRATARSKVAESQSSRSCQPATCGEVYAPARRPSARRSSAIVRTAVDLPFVPTTWIDGKAR